MVRRQQVYYDSVTGQYVDQMGQPVRAPEQPGIKPQDRVYAPDVEGAFGYSQSKLDDYFRDVQGAGYTPIGDYLGRDLTSYLEDVGPYQGYDWANPADFYDAPTYTALEGYERPELERTEFGVDSIEPIAEGIYGGQIAASREGIARSYDDVRTRMMDEIYRTQARPEQAAALLAELGVDQSAAQQAAKRDIQFQQAQSELGIRQAEQGMALQAQQAAAAERAQAAQYLMGAQQYEEGRRQYGYEQDRANRQYEAGLQQWYQEQQAAEGQSEYQSRYGLAQDLASTAMNQYETDRAAQYDYYNAVLQGQQAATQQASQAATYETNLSEGERSKARQYQAERSQTQAQPQQIQSSTSTPTRTSTRRSTTNQSSQTTPRRYS